MNVYSLLIKVYFCKVSLTEMCSPASAVDLTAEPASMLILSDDVVIIK